MAAFQLVRLKRGKTTLEILCKPGTPLEYRKGNIGSLDNVLISDDIFKNQAKGEKANGSDLLDACETEDVQACIKLILEKGEIQLTAAERKAKTEKKRAEIINYIHKYYVDPKTKLPHPVVRIDAALTEMKFRVDGDLPVERQIQEAVKKLPEFIPIKKMEISGILTIPHKHMGVAPNILHKYNISARTERYTGEGCVMEISLVPGDYDSLLGDLNNSLSGEFQFEVEGDGGAVAAEPEPAKGKGKGKGKAARGGGGKGRGGRN